MINLTAVMLLLASADGGTAPRDLPSLLSGLRESTADLAAAELQMRIAQTRRDGETPGLKAQWTSSEQDRVDIDRDHNHKYPDGSVELEKWNRRYSEAKARSDGLARQIAVLERDAAARIASHERLARVRAGLIREITRQLRALGAPCASDLSEESTDDAIGHCGQVGFDGQKQARPPVETVDVAPDSYFQNPNVSDEASAEEAAVKRKKIAEAIRISTQTHSAKPIVVVPPAPGSSGVAPPSFSQRLIDLLERLRRP